MNHGEPLDPTLPSAQNALTAVLSIGGGLVAQATPTTGVGAAGLIASLTGILLAGFQWYKATLDYRVRAERITQLELDLKGSRDRRHEEADRMNGLIVQLQDSLHAEQMDRARLEGRIAALDRSHVAGIQANDTAIREVACQLDPPVPVPPNPVAPEALP